VSKIDDDLKLFENPKYGKRRDTRTIKELLYAASGSEKGSSSSFKPAIVKITSFSRNAEQHQKHLDYISRKGDLSLEDELGIAAQGRDDNEGIVDEWSVDSPSEVKGVIAQTAYVVSIPHDEKYHNAFIDFVNSRLVDFDIKVGLKKGKSGNFSQAVVKELPGKSLTSEYLQELFEERFKGLRIKEQITSRERHTVNVMVSSPKGTNPGKLKEAAHSFAQKVFKEKGHSYVLVVHTDTDFPHAHICVKATSDEGAKLRTYKADLQYWREEYAEQARKRGIMIEATRQRFRGGEKAERSAQILEAIRERNRQVKTVNSIEPRDFLARLNKAFDKDESRSIGKDFGWVKRAYDNPEKLREIALLLRDQAKSLESKKDQIRSIQLAAMVEKYALTVQPKKVKRALKDEVVKAVATHKAKNPGHESEGDKALKKMHAQTKQEIQAHALTFVELAKSEENKRDKARLLSIAKRLEVWAKTLQKIKTRPEVIAEQARSQVLQKGLDRNNEGRGRE